MTNKCKIHCAAGIDAPLYKGYFLFQIAFQYGNYSILAGFSGL